MTEYVIEVYELHKSDYTVEAASKEEALQKHRAGESSAVDNSTEYIETADLYHGADGHDGIRDIRESTEDSR